MPATTWHGSGYDDDDDNYYVAPAPSPGSSARLLHFPTIFRIRIRILSFDPSFCLHLTAPWRHLTIDEDVEDDSVLVSTPATPHALTLLLLPAAPCVVIVLVMAKTLSASASSSSHRICHPKMSRVKLSFAR